MSRAQQADKRYRAAAELATQGACVVVIDDEAGARFDAALWALLRALATEEPSPWEAVTAPARALRWRRLTRPLGVSFSNSTDEAVGAITSAVNRLLGSTGLDPLLVELNDAAEAIVRSTPPVFEVLVRSVEEVERSNCIVVTVDKRSSIEMEPWSSEIGVEVVSATALNQPDGVFDQTIYALGPPRFFPSTLLGAPTTGDLMFLVPSWFRDRQHTHSPLAKYAEGLAVAPMRVVYETGTTFARDELVESPDDESREEALRPQPLSSTDPPLPAGDDGVLARKLALSGSLAVWLDDGERIRTLDPSQPTEERVQYRDIETIDRSTYLLLREGDAEHGAFINDALVALGNFRGAVERSQADWKGRLEQRLLLGADKAVNELKQLGCSTAHRVSAWTDPCLVRPEDNHDFRRLLAWLGVDVETSEANANRLRRAVHQVSAQVRRELELAAAAADMAELERVGHLRITGSGDIVRPIIAARVIGISEKHAMVSRHEIRVPIPAPEAQWLE